MIEQVIKGDINIRKILKGPFDKEIGKRMMFSYRESGGKIYGKKCFCDFGFL